MNLKIILVCFFFAFVLNIEGKDYIAGTDVNNKLIATKKVEVQGKPFYVVTDFFAYMTRTQRHIKGVIAKDLDKTNASVTVYGGGVGYDFITLHFESEKGKGLNYHISIYG